MDPLPDYPCINEKTFEMLKRNTASNPELLIELFDNFIEDANELIVEIDDTISNTKIEEFYSAIHTLKGLCGTIGCSRMFEVLKIMDSLNKHNSFSLSTSYLGALKESFKVTVIIIKNEIILKHNGSDTAERE